MAIVVSRQMVPVNGESIQSLILRRLPKGINKDVKDKVEQILSMKHEYIDHEEFGKRNSQQESSIKNQNIDMSHAELMWLKSLSAPSTGTKLETKKSKPVIFTPDEEKMAFWHYNYARKKVVSLMNVAVRRKLTTDQIKQLIAWYDGSREWESTIFVANIPLVISIQTRLGLPEEEAHSMGQGGLLSAVQKFDVSRGWKFSTYAYHSISRRLYRYVEKSNKRKSLHPASVEDFQDDNGYNTFVALSYDNQNTLELDDLKTCLELNLAFLSQREIKIIKGRFGIDGEKAYTLRELGEIVGVTKERVRQIQNIALEKLRRVMLAEMYADN